jgi:hypothetical protein
LLVAGPVRAAKCVADGTATVKADIASATAGGLIAASGVTAIEAAVNLVSAGAGTIGTIGAICAITGSPAGGLIAASGVTAIIATATIAVAEYPVKRVPPGRKKVLHHVPRGK